MRLSLIALTLLASSYAADSAATNNGVATLSSETKILSRALPVDNKLVKRSLRRNDLDELDSYEEERGIGLGQVDDVMEKVDDVISKGTKADDVVAKTAKGSAKLNALITKNMDDFSKFALVEKLSGAKAYEGVNLNKMSLSTLKQMDNVENVRKVDIKNGVKGTKKTPDGMRRKIEPFDGMKVAPQKYMESHVGRDMQRFGKDGSRWLSSSVVSRPVEQGGGQVLLISSSNPNKGDFLLPKGGWNKREYVKKSALREVVEEGGVDGQLVHGLGKVKFSEGEDKYTYFTFLMKGGTVYDDWSESIRYRLWVSYDEAIELLSRRPHMIEVINRAKAVDAKIKAGTMPALDPKLSKVKLDK